MKWLEYSVFVRTFIYLSMLEREIKKRHCIDRWRCKNILNIIENKATAQRLSMPQTPKAICSPADLLPEVNDFQVAHSDQSTQLQTLHSVPSHGQLVHCTQSLQHSGDVREAVEGEP